MSTRLTWPPWRATLGLISSSSTCWTRSASSPSGAPEDGSLTLGFSILNPLCWSWDTQSMVAPSRKSALCGSA